MGTGVMAALQEHVGLATSDDPLPSKARSDVTGDEALFASLVERQSHFVFRVAYVMLRNPEDAEDVVQETFMKLYRTGAWRGMRDERGFLAKVAWRIALDRLRARVSAYLPARAGDAGAMAPNLDSLPSASISPEESAVSDDWQAAIHRLIDALPEELRQPLALSSVEELNSREIAKVLGISEGTVRTRLMRARQILKQKLAAMKEVRHGR